MVSGLVLGLVSGLVSVTALVPVLVLKQIKKLNVSHQIHTLNNRNIFHTWRWFWCRRRCRTLTAHGHGDRRAL